MTQFRTVANPQTPPTAVISGGNNNPILLDDPAICFRVRRGVFDIFAVENSSLESRRRHLFQVNTGDALFGIAPLPGDHFGLVAVGSLDSELEVFTQGEALPGPCCEPWILALSTAISSAPIRDHARVVSGEMREVATGETLRGDPRTLFWIRISEGTATLPMGLPFPIGAKVPLTGALRVYAETDISIGVERTEMLCASDLSIFNIACQRMLALRFSEQQTSDGIFSSTLGDPIDASLRMLVHRAAVRRPRTDLPLHAALDHLFEVLHVERIEKVFDHDRKSDAAASDRLTQILAGHRLLSRTVLLRPGWTDNDGVPLLAYLDAERRPVALIYRRGRWLVFDGEASATVDAALSARLANDALQIYPTLPPHPLRFRNLFSFGFVNSGPDALRLAFCLAIAAIFASLIPLASRSLVDDALPHGDIGTAGVIIIGLFISILARTVFEAVKTVSMFRSEMRLESRLQPALLIRMINLPTSFFRAYSVGDIVDRVLGIQRARQVLSTNGLGAIVSAAFSIVSLVPILAIDIRLAATVFGLACLLGLVTAAFSWAVLLQDRKLIARKGRLDGFVLQIIMGMTKLRASAAEPMAFAQWADYFRRNMRHAAASEQWANFQKAAQALLPELATIALYAMIVYVMKSNAETSMSGPSKAGAGSAAAFSAGSFVALSAAVAQVLGAITGLADALTQTLVAVPLIERAAPIISTEIDMPLVGTEPVELKGDIDISGISFRYSKNAPLALDGLDIQIRRGEFVAIVGASGSGKSTLLRLLLGFEKPEHGDIFYDGCSIKRLSITDLRGQMGVVLQHGKLFAGTIHSNIVGQSGLGMDEALAAARLVGLDRDIDAMPMGMHTVILDGAATISGGQRQRILIARALVGNAGILLLDEATSALDNRTQAVVTETLVKLPVTRIVIAHRLSTIEAADRIIVLDKGKVAEMGNFSELMTRNGLFAAHAKRQLI